MARNVTPAYVTLNPWSKTANKIFAANKIKNSENPALRVRFSEERRDFYSEFNYPLSAARKGRGQQCGKGIARMGRGTD